MPYDVIHIGDTRLPQGQVHRLKHEETVELFKNAEALVRRHVHFFDYIAPMIEPFNVEVKLREERRRRAGMVPPQPITDLQGSPQMPAHHAVCEGTIINVFVILVWTNL